MPTAVVGMTWRSAGALMREVRFTVGPFSVSCGSAPTPGSCQKPHKVHSGKRAKVPTKVAIATSKMKHGRGQSIPPFQGRLGAAEYFPVATVAWYAAPQNLDQAARTMARRMMDRPTLSVEARA